MRQMLFLFTSIFFIFTSAHAEPVPYVDENEIIHQRHSMLQTHTGYNQTEIHAVLPRLKKYRIKVQKIVNEVLVGDVTFLDPAIEAKDPQGLLLKKVNVFHIDNLEPNSEYHLELVEKGNETETFSGDRRRFRTLDPNKSDIRYTAASCLCDEVRYNDTKLPIWTQKRLTNPDFMMLLGDATYVDSFDVVNKTEITTLNIWQRYLDSFTDNQGTKMYRLKPVISTWDDHDAFNNSDKYTPILKDALSMFNLLYGGRTLPGIIENGHDGTYKWFTYAGVDFAFLDARTFREKFDTPEVSHRYGHLGDIQEEWFFKKAGASKNLLVIAKGDMFGSETITATGADGAIKRITESFYGDHPLNYKEFMYRLKTLPNPYVFITGDIHRASFIRHGPEQSGARNNPFVTSEWITSPLYSYRYNADDENAPGWDDKDRYATKNIYNFGVFSISKSVSGFKIDVEIKGPGTKNKDGSKADWTKPAPAVLTDSLVLKTAYPRTSCELFYLAK